MCDRRTSGVLPIASSSESLMSAWVAVSWVMVIVKQ